MRPAVAALLTILLPAIGGAQTLTPLPGEFAGKQRAVMQALFPRWDDASGSTGGEGHARLADARLIDLAGHHAVAVLVETWTGEACRGIACQPSPADVGVLDLTGGKLQLVAVGRGIAKFGPQVRSWLDTTPRRFDAKAPLIGVNEQAAQTVLRLFRIEGTSLRTVFERHVRWQQSSTKCESTVISDDVDLSPYPLKVTDTCQPLGRSAIEVWRWTKGAPDSTYQLHGPASDADKPDPTTEEVE